MMHEHGHEHGHELVLALPVTIWLAGMVLAFVSGLLGPMVVSARQSIAADMLAHTALAGLGIALLFDASPFLGLAVTLLAASLLMWKMVAATSYAPDAISMLFLSGGLAVAAALVDDPHELEHFLFGDIMSVTPHEVQWMAIFAAVIAFFVWRYWYDLLNVVQVPQMTMDAASDWWRPHGARLLFFLLLAVAVGIGIRTVGALLVGALLVIPVLVSRNFVASFIHLTRLSTVVAIMGVSLGLLLAMVTHLPPSSTIVMTLVFFMPLSWLIRRAAGGI